MITNKSWRRVRSVTAIIAALGIVAVIILVAPLLLTNRHHSEPVRETVDPRVDSQIAADAERLVREELERLKPDSEIYRRYGKFQSLEGSGFARPHYMWQLIERIELGRRAIFADGTATVGITVAVSGPLAIRSMKLDPPLRRAGGDIKVWITHPEFRSRYAPPLPAVPSPTDGKVNETENRKAIKKP